MVPARAPAHTGGHSRRHRRLTRPPRGARGADSAGVPTGAACRGSVDRVPLPVTTPPLLSGRRAIRGAGSGAGDIEGGQRHRAGQGGERLVHPGDERSTCSRAARAECRSVRTQFLTPHRHAASASSGRSRIRTSARPSVPVCSSRMVTRRSCVVRVNALLWWRSARLPASRHLSAAASAHTERVCRPLAACTRSHHNPADPVIPAPDTHIRTRGSQQSRSIRAGRDNARHRRGRGYAAPEPAAADRCHRRHARRPRRVPR